MNEITTRLDSAGRLVIPASFRKALGIKAGATLALRLRQGRIEVMTRAQAIKAAQTLVRRFVPVGRDLSNELVADRRREARRE